MSMKSIKSFGQLLEKRTTKRAPAYQWQDLALRIIKELDVPKEKRSSVFRTCKIKSKVVVEKALNDTKELCKSGEKWRYFFKVVDAKPGNSPKKPASSNKKPVVLSKEDSPF